MDYRYYLTKGEEGACIKYMPAVHVKRSIFTAPNAPPEFAAMITVLANEVDGSKWHVRATEPVSTDLASNCLVITSAADKAAQFEWVESKYVQTPEDLLSYVQKVDLSMTSTGLCGH